MNRFCRVGTAATVIGLAAASTSAQSLRVGDQGGTPRYVQVPNSASLRPANITLECWIQPAGIGYGNAGTAALLVGRPGQGTAGNYLVTWGLYYVSGTGKLYFEMAGNTYSSNGQGLLSNKTVPLGATAHVAATYDGQTMKIFINGGLDSQVAATFPSFNYTRPDPVVLGAANFAFGYERRYDGFLDEVRIWNVARSATDIASTMNVRLCGAAPHLAADWSFTNGQLTDSSGNGNNGVAFNSVGFPAEFTPLTSDGAFLSQPEDATICAQEITGFTANVANSGSATIRWQSLSGANVWTDVPNGLLVSADGPTLAEVQLADTGSIVIKPTKAYGVANEYKSWRCVTTTGCGDTFSNSAKLNICVSDINCDHSVDLLDFFDFFNAWDTTGNAAEINGDGVVDLSDFFAFFNGFDQSC